MQIFFRNFSRFWLKFFDSQNHQSQRFTNLKHITNAQLLDFWDDKIVFLGNLFYLRKIEERKNYLYHTICHEKILFFIPVPYHILFMLQ